MFLLLLCIGTTWAQSSYRQAYFGTYNLTINVPSDLLTRGGDEKGEILFQHRFEGQGRQPMTLELLASNTAENNRLVRGHVPDYLREKGQVIHSQKVELAHSRGWYLKHSSLIEGEERVVEAFLVRKRGRVFVLSMSGPKAGLGIEQSKQLREMAESLRFNK